jgi:hypothetical protein
MGHFVEGQSPRAIGYCAGWRENTRAELECVWGANSNVIEAILRDQEILRVHQGRYHADGHPTAEEALLCYEQYRLDHDLEFRVSVAEMKKCEICGTWTPSYCVLHGAVPAQFVLCSDHISRDFVAAILEARRKVQQTL